VRRLKPTRITYVGHATVLIETNETRILTDPVLRNRVGFLKRLKYRIEPEWFRRIDAALISHTHRDHFDPTSLRLLDDAARLLVPEGGARLLKRKGFSRVETVEVDDYVTIGGVTVTVAGSDHPGRLSSFRRGARPSSVGYIVEGSHRVYFPGDTDLFNEMMSLGKGLDAALLPVWGWGLTLGPGHLNPKRAAEALTLLRPSIAIPIHWGTFYPVGIGLLRKSYLSNPPRQFARHAASFSPKVEVRIVRPGQQTVLRK
jgi:L-ascorbate metabolism protein UlaG (beta-lactamase superfamily)